MVDKESIFGITEYFASGSGFDGTLKSRISDFLVNEINLDGQVVHLTKLGMDASPTEESPACGLLDPDLRAKIEAFLLGDDPSLVIEAPEDKDARRRLHQQMEATFPTQQLLRTPQRAPSGQQSIALTRPAAHPASVRRQEATRLNRSASATGNILHFVLYKENMDTMEAVNRLGAHLRLPPRCLQYAGVKDKRAKTVQRISVRCRDPARLVGYRQPGLLIGNVGYDKKQLQLGDLTGNRFRLVIRDLVQNERATIEQSARTFAQQGFINYFGLQRFGTTDIATHTVGQALLRSDWTQAVALILQPRPNDHPLTVRCRAVWQATRDAQQALQALGRKVCVEGFVLREMVKRGEDWFGALQGIPRNMRMMYVHSYQSYLWNLAASYRIRELGRKPVVGDLVYTAASGGQVKRLKRGTDANAEVKWLTLAELDAFSIEDVLMPLPGYDVKLPQTAVADFLLDTMNKDGIDLRNRHKIKDYSLSGSYRPLVSKARDVQWEISYFDDPEQSLLLSDGDLLSSRVLPPSSDSAGAHMALVMELSLSSSVYATMAIRELMQRSSAVLSQSGAADAPGAEDAGGEDNGQEMAGMEGFVQDSGDVAQESAQSAD